MKRLPKWRLTQTALIRLLFALALVLVTAFMGRAQPPDPAPGEPTPTDPAETDIAEQASAPILVRSPVVQAALDSLNAQDPQTPADLLRAVHILQQLGANDEAKGFLDRVTGQSLEVEQLVEVHKEVGTGILSRIANNKELGPTAYDLVRQVFAAVRLTKRDPERLKGLITSLASEDDEQRRVAMAGLAEAGSHAIPAVLDAYRNPPDGVTPDLLAAAVLRIGAPAEAPLIAAVGAPDAYLQQTAVALLGRVGSKRSRTHLIRPFFSANDALRRAAATSLNQLQMGEPRSIASSLAFLRQQALQHLNGAPPFPAGFDGRLELWTWSGEEKNVVSSRLSEREAAAVAAARMARDAYELSQDAENTRLLLTSRLQADQLLGGVNLNLQRGPGTAYELGVKTGAAAVSDALGFSLEHGLDAAAIGAAEVLADLGDLSSVVGKEWTPLSKALQSPNRRVRHAAARAIMAIDPRSTYPGASLLVETLIDLADARGRPAALIGTPRTDVSVQLAGLLGVLGFEPHRVLRSREFLQEAMHSSDYDVLFLSDSVHRPAAYETLQQLRKDPQSKHLPVVLLVRKGQLDRAEQWASQDDHVLVMPEFANEETLIATLSEAEKLVEDVSVSPQRRLDQAQDALQWLGHLAQYSQTYPWHDVMRSHAVAEKAVSIDELSVPALDLLGYLGSGAAQQLLVENASQNVLSIEQRQGAANAFAESVLRRGLMLRQAEVARQYDRYNASETADEATQEVLGQILDVIETQTKPTAASQ